MISALDFNICSIFDQNLRIQYLRSLNDGFDILLQPKWNQIRHSNEGVPFLRCFESIHFHRNKGEAKTICLIVKNSCFTLVHCGASKRVAQ